MNRCLLLALLAISSIASAVVIRSDVDDAMYRITASVFPAIADMPGEGHGVLIARQWVVTAAHAVPKPCIEKIAIGGISRRIERVFTHPGYKKVPDALIKEALSSGDASSAYEYLASSDDIALAKLASPITDVIPVALYREMTRLERALSHSVAHPLLAERDGQVIGMAQWRLIHDMFWGMFGAEAGWLYVRPGCRGSGIMAAMVARICRQARQAGAEFLHGGGARPGKAIQLTYQGVIPPLAFARIAPLRTAAGLCGLDRR